jgi:hypothetical protein
MAKLTQRQIITALLEGKKIIHKEDSPNGFAQYIHLVGDTLVDTYNQPVSIPINNLIDYELYIETVTFFEALEAMKEGKKAKNLKEGCIVFFDEFEILSYLEDNENFEITKDDLDAKWQILEGDENGIN